MREGNGLTNRARNSGQSVKLVGLWILYAWIYGDRANVKAGTTELLKFKKLQRRLNLKLWECVGLLESLWMMTAKNSIAGDIGKYSNEDIAAGLEWEQDADDLIAALTQTGWLDACIEHRLIVHDWKDHAPNFIKGGMAKSGKHFAVSLASSPELVAKLPPRASSHEIPPTKSSLVKSSQAKSIQSSLSPVGDDENAFTPEHFAIWWNLYPARNGRKIGKSKSIELYKKLTDTERNDLLTATSNYASENSPGFHMDPNRFLQGGKWRDYIQPVTQRITSNGSKRNGPGQLFDPSTVVDG